MPRRHQAALVTGSVGDNSYADGLGEPLSGAAGDNNGAPSARSIPVVVAQAKDRVELRCDILGAAMGSAATAADSLAAHANFLPADHRAPEQALAQPQPVVIGAGGHGADTMDPPANKEIHPHRHLLIGSAIEPSDGGEQVDSDSLAAANATGDMLVSLVFWYKDANPAPIYILDARRTSLDQMDSILASERAAMAATTGSAAGPGRGDAPGARQINARAKKPAQSESVDRLRDIGVLNLRLLESAKHYRPKEAAASANPSKLSVAVERGGSAADDNGVSPDRADTVNGTANNRTTTIANFWPVIKLLISDASERQSGEYKCRVDFRRARTLSRQVRLLVQGKCVPVCRFVVVHIVCCLTYGLQHNESADMNKVARFFWHCALAGSCLLLFVAELALPVGSNWKGEVAGFVHKAAARANKQTSRH